MLFRNSHSVAKNRKAHSMTIIEEFWKLTLISVKGVMLKDTGTNEMETTAGEVSVQRAFSLSPRRPCQTPRLLWFAIEFITLHRFIYLIWRFNRSPEGNHWRWGFNICNTMRQLLTVWRFNAILSAQRSALLIKKGICKNGSCKINVVKKNFPSRWGDRFPLTIILFGRWWGQERRVYSKAPRHVTCKIILNEISDNNVELDVDDLCLACALYWI